MKYLDKLFCVVFLLVIVLACSKDEEVAGELMSEASKITIGIFTEDNGSYTDTGKTLVFDVTTACQTWSRTASGDAHDANSHLHFNAAADATYSSSPSSFSWTEYGPEIDQTTIDSTCGAGQNGVTKTVTSTAYYKDKNVYLKITKVE